MLLQHHESNTCYAQCVAAGIVIRDHVVLHGFEHSSEYVDFGVLVSKCDPLLDRFVETVAHAIEPTHPVPLTLVSMGNGAHIANLVVHYLNGRRKMAGCETRFHFACATRSDMGEYLVFRRHQDAVVRGTNVIIIDDVYSSGATQQELISLVTRTGGFVERCIVLMNRSKDADVQLTVAKGLESRFIPLEMIFHHHIVSYPSRDTCPECIAGVQINLEIGKGAEYHHLYGHPQSKTAV